MGVGSVTFNDPVANFFKAVESARQRNAVSIENIRPMTGAEAPQRAKEQKPVSSDPPVKQHAPQILGVNTAAVSEALAQRQARTKILGNFFDAYA
jgi:hypothetical protein